MKKYLAVLIWLLCGLALLYSFTGCSTQTAEEKASAEANRIRSTSMDRAVDSIYYFEQLRQHSIFGKIVEKNLICKNGVAASLIIKVKQNDSTYYFSIDYSHPYTTTASGGFYQTGGVGYFQYGIFKELIKNRNPKRLEQMCLDYQLGSDIIILSSQPYAPDVWHSNISLYFVYSSPQEIPEPYRDLVLQTAK